MDIQYFQAGFAQVKKAELKEAKTEDAEELVGTIIKGYVTTSEKDRGNDIVDNAALKGSIKNYKRNPIVLFAHDSARPIGKATFMQVDEKGLYVEAIIVDDFVEPKIKAGILKTFSIGYIPKEVSFEDKDGVKLDPTDASDREKIFFDKDVVRRIIKFELIENSIVSVPMNPGAEFGLAKSVKSFFDKELAKGEKSIIVGLDNNPKNMPKSKNLLEIKDEEVEKEEVVDEEAPEKEEAEAAEEEAVEKEEEAPEEESKPAEGETDSSEEGDETPAVEEEVEEEKAFAEFSAAERKTLEFMSTAEGAVLARKTLIEQKTEILELKDKLATATAILKGTPAKKAEANVEVSDEKIEKEDVEDSKGLEGLKSKGFIKNLQNGKL